VLQLPAWESDASRRLDLVVRTTRRSKAEQRPVAVMGAGLPSRVPDV
jgi:hypothetical protein